MEIHFSYTGNTLQVQAVPVPEPVTKVPGRFSRATVEVVFKARNIPPLGYRSYYVTQSNNLQPTNIPSHPVHGRKVIVGQVTLLCRLQLHSYRLA